MRANGPRCDAYEGRPAKHSLHRLTHAMDFCSRKSCIARFGATCFRTSGISKRMRPEEIMDVWKSALITLSDCFRESDVAGAQIQFHFFRGPENASSTVVEFSFPARDHDGGQAIADQIHAGAPHVH